MGFKAVAAALLVAGNVGAAQDKMAALAYAQAPAAAPTQPNHAVTTAAAAEWQSQSCGSLQTHYGPFDYRTDRDKLPVVERRHFTPAIEGLMNHQVDVAGNLSYTLQAFPNHHRALLALSRFGIREKSTRPGRMLPYTIDCFFDRAMRFRPDDVIVRVLFAQYLSGTARKDLALQELDQAVVYAGDNAWSQYNIGLAYFELGQYDKARAQATKASELGFDRTELKDMLTAKGQWRDEPRSMGPASAASAASASATADPASAAARN
ncbi:MAG: ABC transporter permease [Rubrivivax sp.]|nr:ABC transporter permease [Rubrivivax sp.]